MRKYSITLLFSMLIASMAFANAATEAVWERHIKAWNDKDMQSFMADYADDVVLVINNKTFKGKEQVGPVFEKLFSLFSKAQVHHVDEAVIEGNMIYITWRGVVDKKFYPFGTDTFVLKDEKIAYQTVAASGDILEQAGIKIGD